MSPASDLDELEVLDDVDNLWVGGCKELFLTNSVRGIIPVARSVISATGVEYCRWPAPGPWTERLQGLLAERLWHPEPDQGAIP